MANDNTGAGDGTFVSLKIAIAIAIMGALNWGLIGIFRWNPIDATMHPLRQPVVRLL